MMRGHTIGVLVFIAMLAMLAADVSIGCGNAYVYGPVDQKFPGNADEAQARISVYQTPYEVPQSFFNKVQVGDTVKFDGRNWTIVKKGSSNTLLPGSNPP